MEKVHFWNTTGQNCIRPDSDLEDEVLRRAILPDGFDAIPQQGGEVDAVYGRLLVTGGRLLCDDEWCQGVAVHYELRERVCAGWYALRVSFWDRQTAADIGGFTVRAALWTFPPLLQAPWLGRKRAFYCYPVWGAPFDGDLQISGVRLLTDQVPSLSKALLFLLSGVGDYALFHRHDITPHVRLTDVSSLNLARGAAGIDGAETDRGAHP
jgi:hypothetical protein